MGLVGRGLGQLRYRRQGTRRRETEGRGVIGVPGVPPRAEQSRLGLEGRAGGRVLTRGEGSGHGPLKMVEASSVRGAGRGRSR